MALSIKNSKAEQLVREITDETGEGITEAIILSLEERLQRIRGKKIAPTSFERIVEISKECAALPELDARSADEILGYSDKGGFQ